MGQWMFRDGWNNWFIIIITIIILLTRVSYDINPTSGAHLLPTHMCPGKWE